MHLPSCPETTSEIDLWEAQLRRSALADAFDGLPTASAGAGSLTYGELTWASLLQVLRSLSLMLGEARNLTFSDLGSGFGRVVLGVACFDLPSDAAATQYRFRRCVGVEIEPKLHAAATAALQRLTDHPIGGALVGSRVELICADALASSEQWLEGCDVLYVCCTCFDTPLLAKIGSLLDKTLREGAIVITVTQSIPAACLEPVSEIDVDCTWGHAGIIISVCRRE